MRKSIKMIVSLFIMDIILFTQLSCGGEQTINRTLSLLRALPPFITAFHLAPPVEARILQGITEGTRAFETFKDNPTRGNLRNAIDVFQSLVDRGIFRTGNPSVDSRLGPAIAIILLVMNTINPPENPTLTGAINDSHIKVQLTDEQKEFINQKLNELESQIKN